MRRGAGEVRSGRPDVECQRQNDHCKDKAVPGRTSKFKGGNCKVGISAGPRRHGGGVWKNPGKKQGTEKVARYLRPSAQMVRLHFGWSVVRDGTGLEGQRVGWSSLERKVVVAVENYLENCVHTKVDIEAKR